MARKKKIVETEPIKGVGKDSNNLTIAKANPLLTLWKSEMTLSAFKILDTYLSRINPNNPEKRTVIFQKGELEKLLGVTKINKPDLEDRLKCLSQPVDLEHGNSKRFHHIALFERAYGDMDENGIWTIYLTCTPSAMELVFNVEELGYLRYKLRNIVNLTSRYTYILYLYLEKNRWRKSWEISVNELKVILNCENDESYSAFKVFNDRILKRCHKEIMDRTECRYIYEPIKAGRKVVKIRFTLETLSDLELEDTIPGQLTLNDFQEDNKLTGPYGMFYALLRQDPFNFPDEDIEEIRRLADSKIDFHYFGEERTNLAFNLVAEKVKTMRYRMRKTPIPHKFGYLKAMLEKTEV